MESIAFVVDDSATSSRMVEQILRKRRFNVVSMSFTLDLAKLVAAYRPALLVLDVQVKGVDGPSLVRFMRDTPELRDATVLLHSDLDPEALARRAEECAADGYVVKSRDPSALERQLKALLHR
jgi:DNA-binding response OmpR family regulator